MRKKQSRPLTDAEMIGDPDRWPRWPVLPVKRRVGGDSVMGIVFADADLRDRHPAVYELNMYHIEGTVAECKAKAKAKHEYASIDALVTDGWVVD